MEKEYKKNIVVVKTSQEYHIAALENEKHDCEKRLAELKADIAEIEKHTDD